MKAPPKKTSGLASNLLLLLFSILVCLGLLEFSLYILSNRGYFNIDKPAYSMDGVRKRFWVDGNKDFGVWHEPFAKYRHRKSCFDVDYQANSYGARDKERSKNSDQPRSVFLGDSFVEGYCMSDENRLTNRLEKARGTEYLNFGTAGGFGTAQYYLMYKTLAKKFSHSQVIVGILPANDFFENDFEIGKQAHYRRYRPYFVGDYPDYKLTYFNEAVLQKQGGLIEKVRSFLHGYTYTYNAISRLIDTQSARNAMPDPNVYSGFYDYSDKDFLLMKYTLEKLIEEAQGKQVVLLTFPILPDLKRYDAKGEAPLSKKLKEFSEQYPNVLYIDLLPAMHNYSKEWEKYFLPCEKTHWSQWGQEIASQILLQKLPPP